MSWWYYVLFKGWVKSWIYYNILVLYYWPAVVLFETKVGSPPMLSSAQSFIRYLTRAWQDYHGNIIHPHWSVWPRYQWYLSMLLQIPCRVWLHSPTFTALKSQHHQKLWSCYKSLKHAADFSYIFYHLNVIMVLYLTNGLALHCNLMFLVHV